jgi:hypothetical protein
MKEILTSALVAVSLVAATRAGLDDGLELYLPFTGDFTDSRPLARTVSVSGDASLCPDRFGTSDRACRLDGTGDYLGVAPTVSGMRDFTVALWVSFDENLAQPSALVQCGNVQLTYHGHWAEPVLEVNLFVNRDGRNPQYAKVVSVGDWSGRRLHVAVVGYNNNSFTLYLDGTPFWTGTGTYDSGVQGDYSATCVGAAKDGTTGRSGGFLPGTVDEVRAYGRALSSEEIRQLPSAGSPPTAAGLDHFRAAGTGTGTLLSWRTLVELGTLGFFLERRIVPGPWEPMGPRLIAAEGADFGPHDYSYEDASVPVAAIAEYRLLGVDLTGSADVLAVAACRPGSVAVIEQSPDGFWLMVQGPPGAPLVIEQTPDLALADWKAVGRLGLDHAGQGAWHMGKSLAGPVSFYRTREP